MDYNEEGKTEPDLPTQITHKSIWKTPGNRKRDGAAGGREKGEGWLEMEEHKEEGRIDPSCRQRGLQRRCRVGARCRRPP